MGIFIGFYMGLRQSPWVYLISGIERAKKGFFLEKAFGLGSSILQSGRKNWAVVKCLIYDLASPSFHKV